MYITTNHEITQNSKQENTNWGGENLQAQFEHHLGFLDFTLIVNIL